jgi:hypothetical protein
MRGPPSPYRVLAFALECGDRRLADLLVVRLFASARPVSPAAWRTVARIAAALDLP